MSLNCLFISLLFALVYPKESVFYVIMFFHYAHDMENVVPYAKVSLYVFLD
jgi:hypothetical protein